MENNPLGHFINKKKTFHCIFSVSVSQEKFPLEYYITRKWHGKQFQQRKKNLFFFCQP